MKVSSNEAMAERPEPNTAGVSEKRPGGRARIVYTQPPIALGVVVERKGSHYRVRLGPHEALMKAEGHLDPALLDEAMRGGHRVVVEPSTKTICGLLQTSRALSIDRDGDVSADVRRFEVRAEQEALLRAAGSFLHLDDDRAELFAKEALVRARGALRALARLIKLN